MQSSHQIFSCRGSCTASIKGCSKGFQGSEGLGLDGFERFGRFERFGMMGPGFRARARVCFRVLGSGLGLFE